jgi:hypothetical protein
VDRYLKKSTSRDNEDLKAIYGLYKFSKQPTVSNLKQTILFNQDTSLKSYKFVIEKVFPKAVDESDIMMAKQLFKLCGLLVLSEECSLKLSKDLILLI